MTDRRAVPWARWARRSGATVLAAYLALLALLYAVQDALIFPGRASQGRADARVAPRADREILHLKTRDGTDLVAVFGGALTATSRPRADAASRPTVAYFYGNGQYLAGELDHLNAIRRLGVNAIMVDYPGYGASGGRASEAGCYAAADAVYDHLLTRTDIHPRRIVAGGFSLGGAVAIDLASRRPVCGLMVFGTFASLAESAQSRYPFVPVPLLLRHRFASRDKMAGIRVPTLIGHGALDPIVPVAISGVMARAAGGPVRSIVCPDLGHDDLIRFGNGPTLRAIAEFLDGLVPVAGS